MSTKNNFWWTIHFLKYFFVSFCFDIDNNDSDDDDDDDGDDDCLYPNPSCIVVYAHLGGIKLCSII